MFNVIYFENKETSENLHPLNYFRPNVDLRLGGYTILEKWRHKLSGSEDYVLTRPFLQNYTDEILKQSWSFKNNDLPFVWINSQVLPTDDLIKKIISAKNESSFVNNDRIVFLKTQKFSKKDPDFLEKSRTEFIESELSNVTWLDFPWNYVELNTQEISNDISIFESQTKLQNTILKDVTLLNPENTYISNTAKIYPSVFLNAENGPIIIDDEAEIFPFSYIVGPVFIGKNAVIKSNSRILSGTTIGPSSKVAGEITHSIFHSYSNKQHDGFLGHSYMCPWVNLGADTNNSNLKNNYLPVKVPVNGTEINTELQFAGLFAGDHAKSGINTMFNTGTVLGCFANVYGGDYPHKFIPNFAWGNNRPFRTYHLNKAIKTARIVKTRRNKQISDIEEVLIRDVFELTKQERKKD